jgi:hypothetical protein
MCSAFGEEGVFWCLNAFLGGPMFPLVPLFALFAIVGGGATLAWYSDLSREQQKEADRIAAGYANRLFGKPVKELTRQQAGRVSMLTKRHFVN